MPTDEDYAYRAGYQGDPYQIDLWGERCKSAYHEGKLDAEHGYEPNFPLDVDDSNKNPGLYRQFT